MRTSAFGVRHAVIAMAALVAFVWAGAAFAQEAYLSHRLSDQVSNLRKQNSLLVGQNAGYRKDVDALKSGVANEEEARLNGYARPNEKLQLVGLITRRSLVRIQAPQLPQPSANRPR